ncbi:MAG: SDR family NAD(P)-dependent oxidoreductase [Halieaceae bacterium]|nr:SDR family NAD(P)-dependent oxidoreductase [Halieaceae bacterium]
MSKTIVITGAGVGLGRALARRFAKDGESVIVLGRTWSKVEAVANEIGERAMAIECDVASPDSVRAAFARIAEKHSSINVLINNAAVFEPFQIVNATDDQIVGAISINLAGPMLCVRSAVPMMGRGSNIINVCSEGIALQLPHLSVYQSTKAGLEQFSTRMLKELEPLGIRVTCVRAGAMYEEGKTWDVDPDAAAAFRQAALEAGVNLAERPISQFKSAVDIFSALIHLPDDLQVAAVNLHARLA